MKSILALLLALAGCMFATRARAADSCTISTTGVAFGVYDPSSASPLDGTGSLTIDCTGNPLTFTVSIDAGNSGSFANRRMANGAQNLFYNLYLEAAHATIFGDGTGGSSTSTCTTGQTGNGCTGSNPTGGGRRAVRPIYGQIGGSQNVGAGTYTDTINVTVTF